MANFDSDTHALVAGLLGGAIHLTREKAPMVIKSVEHVMNHEGYTQDMIVTAKGGKRFLVSITEMEST